MKPKIIPKMYGKYFDHFFLLKNNLSSFIILINSKTKSDYPLTFANCFNHYFCSIAIRIKKKIPLSNKHHFSYFLSNCILESIYLDPANINEIINSIYAFNVNKAIGHDNFPLFCIAAHIISVRWYVRETAVRWYGHCKSGSYEMLWTHFCKERQILVIF